MSRRRDLVISVAAVAAVVGIVAVRSTATESTDSSPSASPESVVIVDGHEGQTLQLVDLHDRRSDDATGATTSAVDYVRATESVVAAGPLERSDVIRAMCTDEFAPTLIASTNRQLDDVLFALGGHGHSPSDLAWHEYPLTTKADVRPAESATVEVWSVSVVFVDGGSVARQVWHTETVALVWQDGEWKVDGWESRPGPAPALGFEVELDSVDDIRSAAERSPVDGREA